MIEHEILDVKMLRLVRLNTAGYKHGMRVDQMVESLVSSKAESLASLKRLEEKGHIVLFHALEGRERVKIAPAQ